MQLRDFRKMLQGCNPEAEIVCVFEGVDSSTEGDVEFQDISPLGVVERNGLDSEKTAYPYLVIRFGRDSK